MNSNCAIYNIYLQRLNKIEEYKSNKFYSKYQNIGTKKYTRKKYIENKLITKWNS